MTLGWVAGGLILYSLYSAYPCAIYGVMALLIPTSAMAGFRGYTPRKKSTPRGRRLEIDGESLSQYSDESKLVCRLTLTQPFQYRFLEGEWKPDGRLQLFQGRKTLTFYADDPGGAEVIRQALQLEWPLDLTMRMRKFHP